MTALESWIFSYLLNSLWQVPLVFCASMAAARLARPAGPRIEHRIWVGALLLEITLPACHMQPGELWQKAWGTILLFAHTGAANGQTQVIFQDGVASPVPFAWLTPTRLHWIAAIYAGSLLYFAGRLMWGVWTTESMRKRASHFQLSAQSAQRLHAFQSLLGMDRDEVRFAHSGEISGPATVGLLNPMLLVPSGFIEKLGANELDAILTHELAHIQRIDFAKNLAYRFLSLPVAYHPLLSLTRKRLAETRELVCDAIAAKAIGGRESYARSLLRLASLLSDRRTPRILHAIGILDANIFERRVMHLTRRSLELKGTRRLAIGAACVVLAVITCTSALALHVEVDSKSSKSDSPHRLNVKVTDMTILSKVNPTYPVEAKKQRIQGKVTLSAVIGKGGMVENLEVVSGPKELQQSALDAVRQWTYKPYLLNGDPVEVTTTINVIYSLAK